MQSEAGLLFSMKYSHDYALILNQWTYLSTITLSSAIFLICCWLRLSRLNRLKKLSMGALSKQFPFRDILRMKFKAFNFA